MAQVTKRPYEIPKHKYWLVIEDKYLVDYSEDVVKDIEEEKFKKIDKIIKDADWSNSEFMPHQARDEILKLLGE